SRPRRSRSLDSCCAVHGSASSAISLASRRRGIPVQIRWDKAVRAHPDVTIKIVPHGHLHDRSGSVSYRAPSRKQAHRADIASERVKGIEPHCQLGYHTAAPGRAAWPLVTTVPSGLEWPPLALANGTPMARLGPAETLR